MRPARDEEAPRRAYVMKRHYEKHGYTEGCEGCGRMSAGMKPRPHSNACRERMYRELKGTEEGRKWLEESEAKISDYLESKIRDAHGDREHEVEEQRKESTAADAATPASPSTSGETDSSSSAPSGTKTDVGAVQPDKKKSRDDVESDRSCKWAKAKQEKKERSQKREREQEKGMSDQAARQQRTTDGSSPGASSSGQLTTPSIPTGRNNSTSEKRRLDDRCDDDEAPEKAQKIMSVCIGVGAADKRGEASAEIYAESLKEMAEAYRERNNAGECFVQIRKQNSSNKV